MHLAISYQLHLFHDLEANDWDQCWQCHSADNVGYKWASTLPPEVDRRDKWVKAQAANRVSGTEIKQNRCQWSTDRGDNNRWNQLQWINYQIRKLQLRRNCELPVHKWPDFGSTRQQSTMWCAAVSHTPKTFRPCQRLMPPGFRLGNSTVVPLSVLPKGSERYANHCSHSH